MELCGRDSMLALPGSLAAAAEEAACLAHCYSRCQRKAGETTMRMAEASGGSAHWCLLHSSLDSIG